jgi:DNA topoisomerase VI subunit B
VVHKLDRKTFATSRLGEFTSTNGLRTQTGHDPNQWPLVILKELPDNAADEAERAGIAPAINIEVTPNGDIIIADNGPGIAADTVQKILDYTSSASSKAAYASPTRGQQGNALQTILAMPFALDGTSGVTVIEAHSIEHKLTFEIDPLRRSPRIGHDQGPSLVKNGTRITVCWPKSPWSQLEAIKDRFLQIAEDFTLLNPHLTLRVKWAGDEALQIEATDPAWRKWSPSNQTPAHWYTPERFERLIAATIAHDQDTASRATLVREFLKDFPGLRGTAKVSELLEASGVSRMSLAHLFDEGRNRAGVARLLAEMQRLSKPVRPEVLGMIGRGHLERRFQEAGAEMGTFEYIKKSGITADGLPFVVEVAFAWLGVDGDERRLVTGLNFSPAINNPFRNLGMEGLSLDTLLANQRCNQDEPVMVLVHLTSPVLAFTDRGKGSLVLDGGYIGIGTAIVDAVTKVTKEWGKVRKAEERHLSQVHKRSEKLLRDRKVNIIDAAYAVMPEAWAAASSNGTLPANVRQLMYAARPTIQEITGQPLDDKYFTQTLVPDYLADTGVDWDVLYDDRGHFREPHTNREIGIGTLRVREYLAERREPTIKQATLAAAHILTSGPAGNYSAVLFIEKEGFLPLFERVQLAERYDIAIMSTKGMSTTAGRRLVESLCGGPHGLTFFVLHDFDKSGFSIFATLQRNTRRYRFQHSINIIDLGLRLRDVNEMNLASEQANDAGSESSRAENLADNGATPEEIKFLLKRRVELNAMTSEQLVRLIETKLSAHSLTKVIPDDAMLAETFRSVVRGEQARKIVERAMAEMTHDDQGPTPDTLKDQVVDLLRQHPTWRWDQAVGWIARMGRRP